MDLFTAVLLVGGCAVVATMIMRRRRKPRQPATADDGQSELSSTGARDQLEQLRLQDIVLYEGMELTVTGLARGEDRGRRWCECRLLDATLERWLLVCEQEPDVALIGQRSLGLEIGPQPSEELELDGKVYRLERCGEVEFYAEGNLGDALTDGDHNYWDYRRPGPERLWLRRGPSGTASFVGHRVGRHLLCLLPGS